MLVMFIFIKGTTLADFRISNHDFKPGKTARGREPGNLGFGNVSMGRFANALNKALNRLSLTLDHHFDSAIREILDGSDDVKGGSNLFGGIPKADALNAARKIYFKSCAGHLQSRIVF